MDPKKSSNYMQKAIQKASKLIDLLNKQNSQLKQQNLYLQSRLDDNTTTRSQFQILQKQSKQKLSKLQTVLQQKQAKIVELINQIRILQQKLIEKTNKNMQLHEKLGEYAGKNQQLIKNVQKQRKKNLALQNQNQYLLKTFTMHEKKQNQFQNIYQITQQEFKKQIIMVDRTKQAFARKCEQLKNQNYIIKKQLLTLHEQIQKYTVKQVQNIKNLQKLMQCQRQVKRTNDVLTYIIQATLRIKAEVGLYLKVQQIKNYINYRLQHIENLVKPIIQFIENNNASKEMDQDNRNVIGNQNQPVSFRNREIKDLDSLNSLVNRLAAYLSELLK